MGLWDKEVDMTELVGKVIKNIAGLEGGSDEVRIFTECGQEYLFYHSQDCCESVTLNDFEGCSEDLIGGLVVNSEERSNTGDEDSEQKEKPSEYSESFTWTFYDIQTTKGSLWMRWLGESNGYYGEEVSLAWVNKPE